MSGIYVYDKDFIHEFLKKHLLLIGKASEAICIISELFSSVSVSSHCTSHSFLFSTNTLPS
jgi:hypothetical protein